MMKHLAENSVPYHPENSEYKAGRLTDGRRLGSYTIKHPNGSVRAQWQYRGGEIYSYYEWDDSENCLAGYRSFECEENISNMLEAVALKLVAEKRENGTLDAATEARAKEYINARGKVHELGQ